MQVMQDDHAAAPHDEGFQGVAEPESRESSDSGAAAQGRRSVEPSTRLYRLSAVLVVLLILLIVPALIKRIQYAYTYATEKAKVDVAVEGLEQLKELKLEGLSLASRMVAKKVSPSVVHIRTVRLTNARQPGDEWSHLFGQPKQFESQGEGSGVIVDSAGYVVTNNHVISGATDITVLLSDGRKVNGKVIGTDALTDLALLKIDAGDLISTGWGESDELEVGDMVWAVGSPFGLEHTVTFGIVSAKGRRHVTNSPYQDFLQTDAAVNPGNSGGPLVNIEGQVVGINTAIVGSSYQGISFAIPSTIARDVVDRLKSTGKVARGWLGVALRDLTPDVAEQLNIEPVAGVLVEQVVRGSPAERAGIQPGDVIISWNQEPAKNPTILSRLVAATEVSTKAKVVLQRDDAQQEIEVLVDERPGQL